MTEFNNGALLWCVPLAYVLACLPITLGAKISRAWAIAEGAADITITAKVKTALAGDEQLSALSINVDTNNKVVTLTGPAPTQAAADRATYLAQAVEGVTQVRNQLTVSAKS